MDPKRTHRGRTTKVFTEAEYRADPSKVVAHAADVGDAIVVGPDGTTKFMISIPRAETSDSDE